LPVPSRRDDLEALALMLIHLLTPRGLSWTRNGIPKTSEAHNALKAEKRNATPESLCRGLPSEFEEFLSYTRRLNFKERPDYYLWAERFRDLSIHMGYRDVEKFIWPPPEPTVSLVHDLGFSKCSFYILDTAYQDLQHPSKNIGRGGGNGQGFETAQSGQPVSATCSKEYNRRAPWRRCKDQLSRAAKEQTRKDFRE
jgi:hypothetical protein